MNEEPFTDKTEPAPESAKEAFKDLGNAAKRAFKVGGEEARKTAREAFPKVKIALRDGVHDIAWATGYLSAFATTFAKTLAPETAKSGFAEGSESGRHAAENFGAKKNVDPGASEVVAEGPEPSGAS